ncbi:hypothetical protein AVEN_103660-1 [Araneus ventricosus]|uniref:Uncharacterized protein n=1 Tax=Araneus ventricosus TaxID=182803 RepID=A0A4Y2N770_ARAVE|nr:hypothetical protein AVEN_103660-1 [Araneus ventricosus]
MRAAGLISIPLNINTNIRELTIRRKHEATRVMRFDDEKFSLQQTKQFASSILEMSYFSFAVTSGFIVSAQRSALRNVCLCLMSHIGKKHGERYATVITDDRKCRPLAVIDARSGDISLRGVW